MWVLQGSTGATFHEAALLLQCTCVGISTVMEYYIAGHSNLAVY